MKITVEQIKEMKKRGEKIAMLTAYDYSMSKIMNRSGIDIILVGDSLAMVFFGYPDTLQVTMDDMIHHTRAVANGNERCFIVGDMPVGSYDTQSLALENARRFIEAGADGVKIEGPKTDIVAALVEDGIPVMGHIGLTPQTITKYEVQGKDPEDARRLIKDALALEKAGCFSIVLEAIPMWLSPLITEKLSIPTIGIGAGPYCDGQVLICNDMLGIFDEFKPRFVKRYAQIGREIQKAFSTYVKEVKEGKFPDQRHSYLAKLRFDFNGEEEE